MTTFNNAEVLARMNRALSGEGAGDEQVELPVQAYAWRMLRWEADIPMSDEQREQLQVDGERLLVDEGVDRVRQQPARRVVARHARLAQRALQEHHHRLLLRVDGRATDRAGQKQTQALHGALADARHGGGQCPQQTLHRRLEGQLEQRLRHRVRVAAPALVALLPALQLVLRRAQHLALRRPGPRPQQQ